MDPRKKGWKVVRNISSSWFAVIKRKLYSVVSFTVSRMLLIMKYNVGEGWWHEGGVEKTKAFLLLHFLFMVLIGLMQGKPAQKEAVEMQLWLCKPEEDCKDMHGLGSS